MVLDNQLKIYEVRTLLKGDNVTGSQSSTFAVISGSRMLVTLKVLAIDGGATATLNVDNTFDPDTGFETLQTMPLSAPGSIKRVISDFNNIFKLTVNVTGGNATYRVGIALYDNSALTQIENAQIEVNLHHTLDALGNFDSVRIGDGTGLLEINPDGSINTVIIDPSDEVAVNVYGEEPAVTTATEIDVISYTVPADKIALFYRASASGDNIAKYKLKVNGDTIDTRRTMFGGDLTTDFDFTMPSKRHLVLQEGDIISISARHDRPMAGDFEARIQVLLKDAP